MKLKLKTKNYPSVLRKPQTPPSAYREMTSPICKNWQEVVEDMFPEFLSATECPYML